MIYAVFGVTRMLAEEKAKTNIKKGKASLKKYNYSMSAYADHLYDTMKPVKLTIDYCDVGPAKIYIQIAKGQSRDLEIKKRVGIKDGNGDLLTNPKTGQIKLKWE